MAKVFVFFCVCLAAVYGKTQAEELIFGIITPTCFDSLVNRHEFGNIECLKFVLSKALGYAIICGSFILKVPQIIKILRAKDVTGLTPSTFYIEVIIFQSNTIYNVLRQYPISTWGENLVILVQNCLLVILMWQYSKPPTSIFNRLVYSILFFASTFAMMSLPPSQQWVLGSAAIPLSCASRIPQIWANFKQGHTGKPNNQCAILWWLRLRPVLSKAQDLP